MIQTFTVVGGASAYAPGLVAALIHHHRALDLRCVRLYDIDHERLAIVGKLCQRMASAAEAGFQIETHTALPDALRECDAVLNSMRPGGFECRRIDETLPLDFDLPGQETVGPGGFFFALRSVPAALELASVLERQAPASILLNYTNPTNIVTQALAAHTRLRVIGLCDQSDDDIRSLTSALGSGDAEFDCFGLNHASWYSNLRCDGRGIWEAARSLSPPAGLDAEHVLRFELSCELVRDLPGFWPNSYLPYYTHPQRFVSLIRRQGPRTDAITPKLPGYYAHFTEEADREHPNLQHHRGTEGFGDLAVRVLGALASAGGQPLVLNSENVEDNPLAASDTIVEHVVECSYEGEIVKTRAPIPDRHRDLLKQLEEYQLRTAEVAAGRDSGRLADALASNPLVPNRDTAEQLLTKARARYGRHIPVLA